MINTTAFVYIPYWGTLYVGVAWNLDGIGNKNKKIENNKYEWILFDIRSFHEADSFILVVLWGELIEFNNIKYNKAWNFIIIIKKVKLRNIQKI